MCCPCGSSSCAPEQDSRGSQQSAPAQLTHPYRAVYHPHQSCHCPFAVTFIPAQESPGHFPHPIPCMILHHLHPCHHLLLSELCTADPTPPKLTASQPSQGLQAPFSLPSCSIFPWEGQKNPMRSCHCWQERCLAGGLRKSWFLLAMAQLLCWRMLILG